MAASGPLSGITVVDLSRILAGPYSTFLLAELGARVIKVEPPGKGDDAREYGPFKNGVSAYFSSINRGKESIALDLKTEGDRRILDALLERADVIVENFRPGTMERLGYGWEALHTRYPKLIYASASGFGHTGPLSKEPAYDMVVQGLGGIMSITGHPGQPPVRIGMSIGDIGAGLYTTVAINAALLHRERTGEATKVDIAMFDCQLALLENAIMRYTVTGTVPGPLGARHPSITPFEGFSTATESIIIAAGNDALYQKLCAAIGRPDLASDSNYRTNDLRNRSQAVLKAEIERELKKRPADEWIAIIGKAGVPCGPINTVDRALQNPQVEARNMLITVDDPKAGTLTLAGNPLKFSAFADAPTRSPAPALDADRANLLRELGLT
ncbi:MAG TPA: CaiB/BaiF CoA-transferase family protein [Stellaceae bacterium]|nr:CaiB/BaiF CoA-transferase family protein [Stellaceae bacterium]